MTIFDLVFLVSLLASIGAAALCVACLVRGRGGEALRILRLYCVAALVYLATGLAVSLLRPQRVMRPGDPWCFDDWCLSVEKVARTAGPAGSSYRVDFRIFSRALRAPQRVRGAWVYLIDDRGRRYPPDPDPSAAPLDVLLQPGESVSTWRIFRVPNEVRGLGFITGHAGPYCGPMSFLIIGESGCLFNKPALVRVQ